MLPKTLCASASYIAVPAAMRVALPKRVTILAKVGQRDTIEAQIRMNLRARRHLEKFLTVLLAALVVGLGAALPAHAAHLVWAWAIDVTDSVDPAQRDAAITAMVDGALDTARSAETRARAVQQAAAHSVKVARFELETARAAVASTSKLQNGGAADVLQVRAPVAGRVLKLLQESEGAVAAGQPLLEIGNPDSLEVEVEVLSTHAVKIAPGSKVILDRWGGEQAVAGRVRVVEPSGFTKISALGVEEQRVRVIVDFTSPREAWQRLGDGYRVEARFVLWEGKDVLQLPTSALFRHGEGWAVFALDGKRARLTPVETGQRAGLATQVLSGLAAGARVVSHPDDTLSDGARVKPR